MSVASPDFTIIKEHNWGMETLAKSFADYDLLK